MSQAAIATAKSTMKIIAWGKTDTGRKRDHNEDNFLVDDELQLFAVADGMGGHQGGEIASRMALDVLRKEVHAAGDFSGIDETFSCRDERAVTKTQPIRTGTYTDVLDDDDGANGMAVDATDPAPAEPFHPASAVMERAAQEAGHAIFDAALGDSELRGMGTTLTALLYHAGRMHLVHAGDSRAFLFRDGRLQQLTEDHSWIWEQVKSGAMTEEEAKESKFRHIITRSVGFERDVELDARRITVEAGDCFLLCSDGMSNYVENRELEQILNETWYRRAPQALIDLANERGGDDNITVVLVYVANDADG